jgi:hypothetical protein
MDTKDKDNNKLKYPNLFIVGAPKCGTTSLHYYLSQHPEIFMSNPKEPRYFCTDLHEEVDSFNNDINNFFKYRNKDDYLNIFNKVNDQKIIGESSVHYLFSKIAPLKIKKEINNPKIIISLRDPIKFMQSLHSQMLGTNENIKDLNEALNAENERIKGKNIPSTATCPSFLYYKKMAHFSNFINYYFSIFDKKDIKIILLDDIRDKPQETYKEILEFLEVNDTGFIPQFEIKNPNIKPRFKFLNNLLKTPNSSNIKKIYQKIISKKYRKKIFFFIKKRNGRIKSRSTIDTKLELELKKEFKSEVEKLSEIIGRDLVKLWGYDQLDKL